MNDYNENGSSSTSTHDYDSSERNIDGLDEQKVVCKGEIIYQSSSENEPERKIKRFASTILMVSPPTKFISLPSFL